MSKKDKELEFSDGKKRDIHNSRHLEELLDMGKMNPYGTIDKELFAERVEVMGVEAMRSLAIRVGVTPTNRQEEMRKRLLNNFDSYISQNRHVRAVPKPALDPQSKEYKNIEHLLGFD